MVLIISLLIAKDCCLIINPIPTHPEQINAHTKPRRALNSRFYDAQAARRLPSKSPATIPALAPGTGGKQTANGAVPTHLLPPPAHTCLCLLGVSLYLQDCAQLPPKISSPLAALSHLWRGPPSLTLTPRPAQYHLLQEAAQLSGALAAAHPSRAALLSAGRHHRSAQQRLPPSPWSRPRPQRMEESGAARPHPTCAPLHQPKASSEPEAPPGSSCAPQLPRARGPQDRAASDRLAPAASAQGPAPSSGGILSKATVKAAASSQHSSAPSEGPASPEVGPAGVCPAAGAVWDLVPRAGGPFPGPPHPHSPSGTQGTPGSVYFQEHPLARRCSPFGQLGSFPATSDLTSYLHRVGQRHSCKHPCGPGPDHPQALSPDEACRPPHGPCPPLGGSSLHFVRFTRVYWALGLSPQLSSWRN